MKIDEYRLDDWDKTYTIVGVVRELKIVLLNLSNTSKIRSEGVRNLIALDNSDNIAWISEPPVLARTFGYYHNFSFENGKLMGWYGGSTLVFIDPKDGQLLSEEFVK